LPHSFSVAKQEGHLQLAAALVEQEAWEEAGTCGRGKGELLAWEAVVLGGNGLLPWAIALGSKLKKYNVRKVKRD